MADADDTAAPTPAPPPSGKSAVPSTTAVSDQFPALKQLEQDVAKAKLQQQLAEAQAAAAKALVPSLDVTLGADTLAVSDKTTGLDRVLVQMDAVALADDIADIVLDAARKATEKATTHEYRFRVVTDSSVLRAIDLYRLLEGQLDHLRSRIAAHVPAKQDRGDDHPPDRRALVMAGASAAVGLGVQVIGLATKLFARNYQWSGREIPVEGIGLDLDVAHYLQSKRRDDETVHVEVERMLPTPESSVIITSLWALAEDAERRLVPLLAEDARTLAHAKAAADAATSAIAALDAQTLELVKRVSDSATTPTALDASLAQRDAARATIVASLPDLANALSAAQSQYDRGNGLLSDIETFLTTVLTPPTTGRPPALEAARVESLLVENASEQSFLLYACLTASGLDQTIETKIGKDWFLVLTGATAEFALVSRDGRMLASGARSALQSSRMKLSEPNSFEQERVAYAGLERETPR